MSDQGKGRRLSVCMGIRVWPSDVNAVEKLAHIQRVSRSQVIRHAIEAYARSALSFDEYRELYPVVPYVPKRNAHGGRSTGKCKCGAPGAKLHPCPYDEDVDGDKSPTCNCCESCQQKCCAEI